MHCSRSGIGGALPGRASGCDGNLPGTSLSIVGTLEVFRAKVFCYPKSDTRVELEGHRLRAVAPVQTCLETLILAKLSLARFPSREGDGVYRFTLRENIRRYQDLLKIEADERVRRTVKALLIPARRELAVLDAALLGVQIDSRLSQAVKDYCGRHGSLASLFQHQFESSQHSYLIVDPRPGLHIVDINDAYSQVTMTRRAAVAGRPLFEVFPDNPDLPDADGVGNLYASLRAAADSGRPHAMPIQRYDIRNPDGRFVERYWRPLNTPVFDGEGRLIYLLHQVEAVTKGE